MSIHVELRMVLKSARCTVDMLSQILNYKTEDVGKQFSVKDYRRGRLI
jgi:hypothetical protein